MVTLNTVIISNLSLNLLRGWIWRHRWSCTSCLSYLGGRGQDPLPIPPITLVPSCKHGIAGGFLVAPHLLSFARAATGAGFPWLCVPARDRCLPHASGCRDVPWAGSADTPPHLCPS